MTDDEIIAWASRMNIDSVMLAKRSGWSVRTSAARLARLKREGKLLRTDQSALTHRGCTKWGHRAEYRAPRAA